MDQALQACDMLMSVLPQALTVARGQGRDSARGRPTRRGNRQLHAGQSRLDPAGSMTAYSGQDFCPSVPSGQRRRRTQAADQRGWDQAFAIAKRPHRRCNFQNTRDPDRRLRVGYVSPNFNNHCQAFFMMPLLKNHDKSQVEVFCYSDVSIPHVLTDTFKNLADQWRHITGLPHEVVADRRSAKTRSTSWST